MLTIRKHVTMNELMSTHANICFKMFTHELGSSMRHVYSPLFFDLCYIIHCLTRFSDKGERKGKQYRHS